MALPKINVPLYEIEIPSTRQKTKFRPFTVKEEKILLTAQESKDIGQITLAIEQILTNCVQDINTEKLATFDVEYLLVNVRAQSVGNLIEFKIKDKETGEEIELEIDLNDIKVHRSENHTNMIRLSDDIVMEMRYPTLEILKKIKSEESAETPATQFEAMISCISRLYEGEDQVHELSDYSQDEINEFVDNLTAQQINEIKIFFETMPKLRVEKEYTRKDGVTKIFVAEGTETFFI